MNIIGLYSSVPQCGKSSIAKIMALYGWTRLSLASPIKKAVFGVLVDLLGDSEIALDMVYGTRKDEPIPQLKGLTGRRMQQTLGSEWGRDCVHPDVWVNCAMAMAERNPDKSFIVDDVRFANEAEAIRARGGLMVKVTRSGVEYDGLEHRSEGGLDDWPFDLVLRNDGSMDDLEAAIGTTLLPVVQPVLTEAIME